MHPIKNLDGIFRVLSRLNGARRDWTLTLVGQVEPRYRQLAIDLAIDQQIEWKGLVEHHAVSAELQQANLLLMFSHHENLSCVVCESLCCGVPVVASRVGGLAEIIDATNGMLCSAGDEEALLTLILAAMENYGRFDQAKIATKAAGLFDESLIAHKFISLYHQLLSRK
jgi:glycosyltransferase involved in cell wall biosynthesis